jgi:predicted peptidase
MPTQSARSARSAKSASPASVASPAGTSDTSTSTAVSPQQELSFKKRITRTVGLRYLLALPKGYDAEGDGRWPLVLFLHGAGERGDDLQLVKKHGIPRVAEELGAVEAGVSGAKRPKGLKELNFIAVSPQCPTDSNWNLELDALGALLDEMEATHKVDPDRVYVTGLSMGGYGTFALTAALPARFAAAAPICGGGDPRGARRMWHVPLWVFHGAKDATVPLRRSAEMVEAIALQGGSPRFTVYPDAKHDSWTETYNNPEFFKWLLSHRRSAAPA